MDFRFTSLMSAIFAVSTLVSCASAPKHQPVAAAATPAFDLISQEAVIVPGADAHFDYLEFDRHRGRVLAAHSGRGQLEVLNIQDQSIQSVAVGEAHGVAVDDGDKVYIAGDGDQKKVVFVTADTLKIDGRSVRVTGPVDAIAFDPKNGNVYAAEDDGSHVWVISVHDRKLIATISLTGVPEYLVFDGQRNRVFVNIKTKNTVAVINPSTNTVEGEWSTLPAEKPHGLAVDETRGRLFVAGANGKLVSLDAHTGEKISELEIASGTDQITYDPFVRKIYCASRGFLVTAVDTDSGLTLGAQTPSHKGAHTLATDPSTQAVWVAYSDEKQSYLQQFKPNQPPSAAGQKK